MKRKNEMLEQVNMVEKLKDEVVRLCTEYPNAEYTPVAGDDGGCSYFRGTVKNGPENVCGCIVGIAARNIGYEKFLAVAQRREAIGQATDVATVLGVIGEDYHSEAAMVISGVQSAQDRKCPWQTALQLAYKRVSGVK